MNRNPPSLRRISDVVDYLIDEHTGVIKFLREEYRQAGTPNFFHYYAQACNTKAFSRQENFGRAGGASIDRDRAIAKAVGEAVERYCSALFQVEELPLTSYESASFQCVHPGTFALFSPEQYAEPGFLFVPFTERTVVRWVPALDPLLNEIIHVPAGMVYVPYYYYQDTGDQPVVQPISTGLACHCSPAEAALSAICEVIERDAFIITWQARMARPQIRVETLSEKNRHLLKLIEETGYSVTLFNITMDSGVPTILSVARSKHHEGPPFAVAAASSLSPEVALQKSLEELEHTRSYCHMIKTHLPRLETIPGFTNIEDQESHLNFWCDEAHSHLAAFLFESDERIDFGEIENIETGDPQSDLKVLLEKINMVGHRVLLCDITTPDIRQLGLYVVRAVIPGFQPFFVGYRYRALGGSRLWTIPQKLGYEGVRKESGDNPLPHPYP